MKRKDMILLYKEHKLLHYELRGGVDAKGLILSWFLSTDGTNFVEDEEVLRVPRSGLKRLAALIEGEGEI